MRLKDDEFLLSALRESNYAAYTEIYHRYNEQLLIKAIYDLDDADEAEDVVQEIFKYIWECRATLYIESNLKGYLHTAVKNKCIDVKRKRQVRSNFVASEAGKEQKTTDLSKALEDKDTVQHLLSLLRHANPSVKLAFELYYLKHLSYKDIAMILGLPVNSTRSYVSKAVQIIRNSEKK